MILHTIYDTSLIFSNMDYYNPEKINTGFTELEVDGVRLLVMKTSDDEIKIERILSTNPLHFLNPRLQPGAVIRKTPG
ncbi:hypothetical protein CLHUN_24260 [Ruminiclostridium hungatei]|uniref:YlzJ-like protein n=1 Tax=Ruminiclostridium hungatei TaxID=48256 RepID=A0A1V4SJN3_RUMHU|nr:YlzJ-like family protein [Ruminiclostridium hungatei]OPX43706.1 hypothetical protein CLHUN_24260 [Ruminiclostridium hungatei]